MCRSYLKTVPDSSASNARMPASVAKMACRRRSPAKLSGSSPRGSSSSRPSRAAVGVTTPMTTMAPSKPSACIASSQVGTVALLKKGTDRTNPLTTTSTAPGPIRLRDSTLITRYTASRWSGGKCLAVMPLSITASPPPSHATKPIMWTNSQKPLMCGSALRGAVGGPQIPPPARASGRCGLHPTSSTTGSRALEAAMEIHQPLLEILEFTADFFQLPQVLVDLPRDCIDLRLEVELLFRLAPIRAGPGGNELVAGDEILPLGMGGHDVLDDAANERQSPVGFGEREELVSPRRRRHPVPLRGAE